MIAWCSQPRRKRSITAYTFTDSNYCDSTTDATATCSNDWFIEWVITSVNNAESTKELIEAIKVKPPQEHERQMKIAPSKNFIIPYNRKILQHQYKAARR